MYEYAVIYWIYVLKYVYRLKIYYLNVLLIIYIYTYIKVIKTWNIAFYLFSMINLKKKNVFVYYILQY